MDLNEFKWITDYGGLWTIVYYLGLLGLMMDYGLSWTIVDYCDTLWTIVDYHGFSNMHHHGIAWITRYAPQASYDA